MTSLLSCLLQFRGRHVHTIHAMMMGRAFCLPCHCAYGIPPVSTHPGGAIILSSVSAYRRSELGSNFPSKIWLWLANLQLLIVKVPWHLWYTIEKLEMHNQLL